jgi:hypothetical protein
MGRSAGRVLWAGGWWCLPWPPLFGPCGVDGQLIGSLPPPLRQREDRTALEAGTHGATEKAWTTLRES